MPAKTLMAALLVASTALLGACGVAAAGRTRSSFAVGFGPFDDDPGDPNLLVLDWRTAQRALGGLRLYYELARSTRDATYLGVGLYRDLRLGRRLTFTPFFGPGYYDEGDDKDLGLALQFRSAVELGVDVGRGRRLAFQYHHLSNMSLSQPNPGAESYLVTLSLPLRR